MKQPKTTREILIAIDGLLDDLIDSLEDAHELDCRYNSNHKGALTAYDSCDCGELDVAHEIQQALSDYIPPEERRRAGD